jgi:hypothetical protein
LAGFRFNGTADGTAQAFTIVSVKSLAGNHAAQSTTASRPMLGQSGVNYGTLFDGVDDSLVSPQGGGGSSSMFYCAAVRPDLASGVAQMLWNDRTGLAGYGVVISSAMRLSLQAGDGVAYTSSSPVEVLNVGTTYVLTAWDDGTNLNTQINGGAVTQVARPVVVAGATDFSEGKLNGGASQFFTGILFNRVYCKNFSPDAGQRAQIQRYIAASAGVTL